MLYIRPTISVNGRNVKGIATRDKTRFPITEHVIRPGNFGETLVSRPRSIALLRRYYFIRKHDVGELM